MGLINFTDSVKGVGRKWLNEHGIEAASKVRSSIGDAMKIATKGKTKEEQEKETKKDNLEDER